MNTAGNDADPFDASTPLEMLASGSVAVSDQVSLDLGAGAGLTTGLGTAAYRVLGGVRWVPESR